MSGRVLEADRTWVDGRFADGIRVEVDDDGRIARVGALDGPVDERLRDRALLPGFVNAHSHAFQRALRGRGERFPDGAGSFWTWREAMYSLVAELDVDGVYSWSRLAFDEMRAAGITAVGEFHYLHHEDPSQRDFRFDDVVLEAAHDSGLRLVLLETYYRTGGVGRPLAGAQERFAVDDPPQYWHQLDLLGERLRGPRQTLGAVAHSIRAADPGEIARLHSEARRRGLVFHMHLEEQRQEIEDCRARYGRPPLELVHRELAPGSEFTAVHCTHSAPDGLRRLTGGGARVCLCPLTEANLADGIADLPALAELDGAICLGTDSNARISMLEEMRWLEYAQRLRHERRGVLVDAAGDCAPRLLDAATRGGAAALGLDAGAIEPGRWADFALVDLTHPSLTGWEPETLAAALVLGAPDAVVVDSCVGGRWQRT